MKQTQRQKRRRKRKVRNLEHFSELSVLMYNMVMLMFPYPSWHEQYVNQYSIKCLAQWALGIKMLVASSLFQCLKLVVLVITFISCDWFVAPARPFVLVRSSLLTACGSCSIWYVVLPPTLKASVLLGPLPQKPLRDPPTESDSLEMFGLENRGGGVCSFNVFQAH